MNLRYLEGRPFSVGEPEALAIECVEADCRALLLVEEDLPPEFFDLSSRALGALLHRLDLYGISLAVVVSDVQAHSAAFQAFVGEVNRGRRFRFFRNRSEAVAWLATLEEDGS